MSPAEKRSDITNGWNEYSKLVLKELERLSLTQEKILEDMHRMKTEMAVQKMKNSLLGMLAGAIAGGITWAIQYFKGGTP